MSRPIAYALLAMGLYALQNVIIEVRLSKYTTMGLLLYWYFTLAPLAVAGLAYLYYSGQTLVMPNWQDVRLIIAVGVMFFFADFFYVGAYTNGGSLLAVTSLVVLFPAMAQLIKLAWVGGGTNYYHLFGFLLAAAGVILIMKGSPAPNP